MKRVDLNALRVFVTVAENGSFSAGAKALQMPSSNVSRQISQLEESLQLRLIQRSTRHMKLTSAGQTLLASMRPLLEQLAATEAELTQQQAEPEGPLRLCLPKEIGPSLFAPLMAQFALLPENNRELYHESGGHGGVKRGCGYCGDHHPRQNGRRQRDCAPALFVSLLRGRFSAADCQNGYADKQRAINHAALYYHR